MIATPGRIARLSPQLVNQIAAGEVIERPASVVKELIENCIDAGATSVDIELEEGGKRLIRVSDDGFGIHRDDLELAVASHATSKLLREEELHSIATLGFRGEALASIASIAEFDLVSRPPGQAVGERMVAKEGEFAPGPPESIAPGTRVTVKNLFYNVPARKRFLKTERAELGRIRTTVQHLALAQPLVSFSLSNDGREVLRYRPPKNSTGRVADVLGSATTDQLLALPDHPRLRGWIGRPDYFKGTANSIYTFLNGRFIKDKVIIHALREGYAGFQIPGRHPVAVLFLDLDPSEVDVNVHPTKQEVRFRDSSDVHRLVHRVVRKALEGAGSVPNLGPAMEPRAATTRGSSSSFPEPNWTADQAREARSVFQPGDRPTAPPGPSPPVRELLAAEEFIDGREHRVFQVRNSFLIVEEDSGLVVIDQHALHEKILYEEILESRERGDLRQPLLIPETVRLEDRQWQAYLEARSELDNLGFEVAEFGEDTVVVRTVPAGFESSSVERLLKAALDQLATALEHGQKKTVELRESLVATMACKRAVKAGDRLTREQQLDLVRGRARAFQPQNCPHGRPSELFISWSELERRFDRK